MSVRKNFPIDNWDFKSESILADLPPKDYELLMARHLEQSYARHDVLFREGAYPSGIFYIRRGKIKKYKVDNEGREQIINVAHAGQLIGYHAVLSEDRYPDSAAAMEDSVVDFILREDFLHAVEHATVLSTRLLKTLSHEFAVLANNLTMFAQKNVRERLALQLLVLREKYSMNTPAEMPVEINISREDLASLAGTARESVVRVLTAFREEGILETKGRKIIIYDLQRLADIADFR